MWQKMQMIRRDHRTLQTRLVDQVQNNQQPSFNELDRELIHSHGDLIPPDAVHSGTKASTADASSQSIDTTNASVAGTDVVSEIEDQPSIGIDDVVLVTNTALEQREAKLLTGVDAISDLVVFIPYTSDG